MAKILVLYASSHGQTAKVAGRLASRWRLHGHEVEARSITDGTPPSPAGFDFVALGSRLQVTFAGSVERYAKKHRAELAATRSCFFAVSMSASSPDAEGRAPAELAIRRLLDETGWAPEHLASFAGALPYRKYDPITRFMMKQISARVGHTTDTSRDHEFTDWAQVDAFANEVAAHLPPAVRAAG